MNDYSLQFSPALWLAFFMARNTHRFPNKFFHIKLPLVHVINSSTSWLLNSPNPERTLWISTKLSFALNVDRGDLIHCTFYVDEDAGVKQTVLFVGFLPLDFPSDEAFISDLCVFNLDFKIASKNIELTLKTCKKIDHQPHFTNLAKISFLRNTLSTNLFVDDGIREFFSIPRLAHIGDTFVMDVFEKNRCLSIKTAFKIVWMEGIASEADAFISFEKSEIQEEGTICGHIPSLEPLTYLPEVLKHFCDQIFECILVQQKISNELPLRFLLYCQSNGDAIEILKHVSARLSVSILRFDCLDFWSDIIGKTVAQLKVAFDKIRMFEGYCIVTFENFKFIGVDESGNDKTDMRVIKSFKQYMEECPAYCFFLIADAVSGSLSPQQCLLSTYELKFPFLSQSDRYQLLVREFGKRATSSDLWKIASQTKGFSLTEIRFFVDDALYNGIGNCSERIDCSDLTKAVNLRNSYIQQPFRVSKIAKVSWDDIGGLEEAKKVLQEAVNCMLTERGYKRSGIILYGPPGCGKTLLAKAVANQFSFPILNIKGPELFNKYVGESESNIREAFENARQAAPCIMFFDELDALVPNRGNSSDIGGVTDRIVAQFLTEMDDILEENILILGATNRLDLLDPSVLVSGRFERTILVTVGSDITSRLSVLNAASKSVVFMDDVNLLEIAGLCGEWASGADLHSLISQAVLEAIRERIREIELGDVEEFQPIIVTQRNLINALEEVFKNKVLFSRLQELLMKLFGIIIEYWKKKKAVEQAEVRLYRKQVAI